MRFSTDFQSIPLLVVYCSFNPSIVIAATDINVSDHLKNNISFNLGPILGFQLFICTEERLVWLKLIPFY
jgi:hypothetical protein